MRRARALRGGRLLAEVGGGDLLGDAKPPGVLHQLHHLVVVDGGDADVEPVAAHVGLRSGARALPGSGAIKRPRSSFGNPKPMICSSRESATNTICPTRNFTWSRTNAS